MECRGKRRILSLKLGNYSALDQQLAALPELERKALKALWDKQFGKPPGPSLRREILIPILAYRLQELAFGGLKPSVARRLEELAQSRPKGSATPASPSLKPGTRLVREWRGKLHEVSVLPDGYEYGHNTYRSLSEIARLITGTRWSGPAFFGIRNRNRKSGAK